MKVINAIKVNAEGFILVALAYAAIYFLNNYLTDFLYVLPGAHLVHIPSGFKFLFVMIARWSAALAIAMVSFINAYFVMFQGDALLDFQLACASGLAPMLTWLFFKNQLHIDDNLGNMTFRNILAMGVFFALLNSSMHQLVLFWYGSQSDFTQGLFVMAVGDITGLYIVMAFIKFGAGFLKKPKPTDTGRSSHL